MNPLAVETCLVAALGSFFSGAIISPGTNFEKLTPGVINIIAAVPSITHTCGPLYKAEAAISLCGNSLLGSSLFGSLTSAAATLQAALTSETFAVAWPTGSPTFGGLYVQNSHTSQHEEFWQVVVNCIVGVQI